MKLPSQEQVTKWASMDDPEGCTACSAIAGCCSRYPNCPGNPEWKPDAVQEATHAAAAYMAKHGAASYAWRTCWNCNGAHEHLKQLECPIWCIDCGHLFFKGIDISVPRPGA